jgi:hypothetical protein
MADVRDGQREELAGDMCADPYGSSIRAGLDRLVERLSAQGPEPVRALPTTVGQGRSPPSRQ